MAAVKKHDHSKDCLDCAQTRAVLPSALFGGIVLLAFIIVGAIIVVRMLPASKNPSLTPEQREALPSMPGKGFFTLFGVVTDISGNTITLRSVSPIGDASSTVFYQIAVSDNTTITHQIPKATGGAAPQFTKESGMVSSIHKGDFLSATTNDIISSVGVLHAVTVDYSEASPFVNINNNKK